MSWIMTKEQYVLVAEIIKDYCRSLEEDKATTPKGDLELIGQESLTLFQITRDRSTDSVSGAVTLSLNKRQESLLLDVLDLYVFVMTDQAEYFNNPEDKKEIASRVAELVVLLQINGVPLTESMKRFD